MEGAPIIGFVLVLLGAWALAGVSAYVLAKYRAMEAVVWAAADPGLRFVEQWEVRAMAAYIWEKLPLMRWVQLFVPEEKFEALCVVAWDDTKRAYQAAKPRECTELFGEPGPF